MSGGFKKQNRRGGYDRVTQSGSKRASLEDSESTNSAQTNIKKRRIDIDPQQENTQNRNVSSVPVSPSRSLCLKKVLVVMICVGAYDHLQNLPGTQRDKQRLQQLFEKDYSYTVIANEDPYVKPRQMKVLLSRATTEFLQTDYDAVMMFYSGHGSELHLLLSNYNPNDQQSNKPKGVYLRSEFEQCFNSNNLKDDDHDKVNVFKFYFIDACRGETHSMLFQTNIGSQNQTVNQLVKGDKTSNTRSEWTHPEANKCIMYSNMNTYASYEVPFDENTNEIALQQCMPGRTINDNTPKCGLFMNAVFKAYKKNAENGFRIRFSEIQDKIRDFAVVPVPMLNAVGVTTEQRVGLEVDESGNLRNSIKRNIVFCHPEIPIQAIKSIAKCEPDDEWNIDTDILRGSDDNKQDDTVLIQTLCKGGNRYRWRFRIEQYRPIKMKSEMKSEYGYSSDFDTNGIVYALATNAGKTKWTNPSKTQKIKVTAKSKHWKSASWDSILGREGAHCHTDNEKNSWLCIDFGDLRIKPTMYTLRHGKYDDSCLRSWNFEGSVDGTNWKMLRRHTNDTALNKSGQSASWSVQQTNGYFSKFRIYVTAKNSWNGYGEDYCLCLGGFEIYGFVLSVGGSAECENNVFGITAVNEENKKHSISYSFISNLGVLSVKKNGKEIERGGYGAKCKQGDEIEMKLDLQANTTSFSINGTGYGIATEVEAGRKYSAFAIVKGKANAIRYVR